MLQEKLPAFSDVIAIKIIEEETNNKINAIFRSFEKNPIAAASVAQVHRGVLKNGNKVAIKILRPNIEQTLFKDFKLFYGICNLLEFFSDSKYAIIFSIFIVITFFHSALSISEIFEDYISSEKTRKFANMMVYLSSFIIPTITLLTLYKL